MIGYYKTEQKAIEHALKHFKKIRPGVRVDASDLEVDFDGDTARVIWGELYWGEQNCEGLFVYYL